MFNSLLFTFITALVNGHGSLVSPPSRNRIDHQLPWNQRTPPEACTCANATTGSAGPRSLKGCDNAQACYWYSQGCTIGCPKCDSVNGRLQQDLCGLGKKATINNPLHRTVNRNATAGSIYDIYKHNPWRAPGSAPVMDACGLAGGTPWKNNVSEWGWYVPTKYASHGDYGSKVLPEMPSDTVWKIGKEAEAIWQITANHGGGYQYRLCPSSEPLNEECFQKYPIEFTKKQYLQFNNGTRMQIQGTFVDYGTLPENSTWAMLPIPPRCLGGDCKKGNVCRPCGALKDCTTCDNTPDPSFTPPCDEGEHLGLCSGNQPSAHGSAVGVVDILKVPNLSPGKYVLGWRYDCEATAQVWSNCADITLGM